VNARLSRWLCLLALTALLGPACRATSNPQLTPLQQDLALARSKGAQYCAPREFAAAEAAIEMAQQAYLSGNRRDGDRRLTEAREQLDNALEAVGCYSDLDNDGHPDLRDGDPYRAEDFDNFADEDGVPEDDNDGDGFLDWEDDCPNEPEDFDGFEDEDGCPELDNDYDGVSDDHDQCPTEAEDIDGFQDDDGCPDLDNDGDHFPDLEDLCPDHPETINGFLDDDGCPDQLPQKMKFILLPQVEFLDKSVFLTRPSMDNLAAFAEKLKKNPGLYVRIESHAAQRPGEADALELTKQRAEKVKAILVECGIPEVRLMALGFGGQRPIADNLTFAGRRINDRIEFIVYLP